MTPPVGALVRDMMMPQLGHGRVATAQPRQGTVTILYSGDPTTPRELRWDDQKDVVRARLHPGQRIQATLDDGRTVEADVARALGGEADAAWRYALLVPNDDVGTIEVVLTEDRLAPLEARSHDPRELLAGLVWDDPGAFFARAALLRRVAVWYEDSFGIPALLGARVHFLPHQLHAARRVLTDRRPRFVLADEVGLGKTIEAGLIAQSLTATEPGLRVLVIAPGSMSRQWLCELFLRFGEQVFVHLDVSRLALDPPDELYARPRIVVSTTALEAYPAIQEKLLAQRWDLVIVDEAHQTPPSRPLYGLLRKLADQAPGLLLLSATPGKRDEEGLLGLLALVAPEAYREQGSLARRLQASERVTEALAATLAADDALEAGQDVEDATLVRLGEAWDGLLPGDAVVAELVGRLKEADPDAVGELAAYVQEYHRLERRIIRTRRAAVRALGTALCRRELELLRYQANPAEEALVAHVDALPTDGLGPLQQGLRGLYARAACTTPVAMLELLERRRSALSRRGGAVTAAAAPPKKGRGKKAEPAPAPKAAPGEFDLLDALASDPGPADEAALRARAVDETPALPGEATWLERAVELVRTWMVEGRGGCARFRSAIRWIQKHLEGGETRKVLVFSQEREVVDELAQALGEELGEGAALAFHHGLEDAQLSDVALRFQQPLGCRVLVSDELGGEGRNFQVASAVLHLDAPWAVARLEQRIGRLDRLGRDPTRPATSVALQGPSPTERALLGVHREVFRVYEQSIGGLEFVLPGLQRRLSRAACEGGAAVTALRPELQRAVDEARARADEAYERSLDASRRSIETAKEHAEVLGETDGAPDGAALAAWGRMLGVQVRSVSEEEWVISWAWEHLRRVPAGLAPPGQTPTEGRVRRRGTFTRARALQDESLEFFAPGHPIVDALVRDAEGPSDGRAVVMVKDLGQRLRGRCFLLALTRTALDEDAWIGSPGAAVPHGLVHRARQRLWPTLRSVAVELLPGKSPPAAVVKEREVLTRLEAPDASARGLDRDEVARRAPLFDLLAAAKQGLDLALSHVAQQRRPEVEEAAAGLKDDLREDVAFLRGLAERDPSTKEDVARELDARERLLRSVAGEKVHLDALAVIFGG